MNAFTIEKNIPIPPSRGRGREGSKYPFHLLDVGDSVLINGGKRTSARASAYRHGRLHGKTFVCRVVDEKTVRIWRTA